jgi:hypothetical protein
VNVGLGGVSLWCDSLVHLQVECAETSGVRVRTVCVEANVIRDVETRVSARTLRATRLRASMAALPDAVMVLGYGRMRHVLSAL